jgi:GNAT superfamily N-acetyltransferase
MDGLDAGEQPIRIASRSDLNRLTTTVSAALSDDPLSNWVFPEADKLALWWHFSIDNALRYGWVWVAGDYAAVSVWIPPGSAELAETESAYLPLLRELVRERASAILQLFRLYEAARRKDRLHYYLTFLGTHPDHRGTGLGVSLLKHNLDLIDAERMPAYLAVSDPIAEESYKRVGFTRIGGFSTPDGSYRVATMWRDARVQGEDAIRPSSSAQSGL